MLISFYLFQWILAITMVGGLVVLVLPLVRIVKCARVPVMATLVVVVPLINVAWLLWVANRLPLPTSAVEEP